MELTIHVDPVGRTVRFREVHALAAGDSCSVVLEGVRGADVASLRLALYRDAASDSPVASCPSFAPVRGHPNLATGDLRLDTAEMAAWFEAVRPEPGGSETDRDGSGSGDAAERAVRTDGWMVVSEPTRTWAACRVPVVLRPGAGVSGVVDPTSIQSLVEGLVSAAMSEALASKADKATTLDGYGITDAATKSELDSVSSTAGGAMTVAVEVRTALFSKADLVDGKVPANQLPSYVDDVLEYDSVSAFPATGEGGKIYVAKDTNKTYRWGGTQYVEISQSLALGETADTAYPGDKGKAAAELADLAYTVASQAMHDTAVHEENKENPHEVTAAQVGAYTTDEVDGKLSSKQNALTDAQKAVLNGGPYLEKTDQAADSAKLAGEAADKYARKDEIPAVVEPSESATAGQAADANAVFKALAGKVDNIDGVIKNSLIVGPQGTQLYIAGGQITYGYFHGAGVNLAILKLPKNDGTFALTSDIESATENKADKSTTLAGYGITDAATMASLAPEYSTSSAYSVGAFVYHDGNIYQCTTAIADGGEAWNAAHWELRKLDDFFTNSNSFLTGTIDARLPYPLYAVPSTGLLKDRAINTTSLASVTVPDNFTDLLIRATVGTSLSVTMPEAIATKYGDTFPGEAGEYLITITKTGASEAYVRTIKLEVANA